MEVNSSVIERYSEGAKARQADLCCPVNYDSSLLQALPQEIIEKDYGCGDPSRYVQPGDTVLDLGSGGGKICYMAAQIVGQQGHVIGVDMNDDMLGLARQYQVELQEKFGARIDFVKGKIQDLKLDVEVMEAQLANSPINSADSLLAFETWKSKQRDEAPLIEDHSISLVLSNCVLNLVSDEQKQQLVNEIWRVTKPGGRIAISDIISDQPIPQSMKDDPELWSGCISGAFGEKEFLDRFAEVGFQGVRYDKWDHVPWKVINDIQFRSVTLVATKPELKNRVAGHAMYAGPYDYVSLAGKIFERGLREQVSADDKNKLLSADPLNFIDIDEGSDQPGCCIPASGSSSCC
jgi:ubiquinone/menaquinone biosynthesis C-methylase UbiE